MKQLSKLSPAETLVLLQDTNARLKELLKVTFMDLLLKQVVRTIEVQKQSRRSDIIRVYKYVIIGQNFSNYQPLPHENVFLAPFFKSKNVQILFRHIVKMGYQNSNSESSFQRILSKSPNLQFCFKRNIYNAIFGGFNVEVKGIELRNIVQGEIAQLEKELPQYIANEPEKALHILKVIKGNIFILSNIEFDLLKQIDKELLNEMNKEKTGEISSGCSGCTLDSFDNYSHSFDSSCSCDSGCSSSGCSGCGGSGCGGGD
ncbi:MAG: hypothetical protein H7Z76_15540 [Methylotenera sp.]|nr:hypothetical protein [Flavobacterium sp.]